MTKFKKIIVAIVSFAMLMSTNFTNVYANEPNDISDVINTKILIDGVEKDVQMHISELGDIISYTYIFNGIIYIYSPDLILLATAQYEIDESSFMFNESFPNNGISVLSTNYSDLALSYDADWTNYSAPKNVTVHFDDNMNWTIASVVTVITAAISSAFGLGFIASTSISLLAGTAVAFKDEYFYFSIEKNMNMHCSILVGERTTVHPNSSFSANRNNGSVYRYYTTTPWDYATYPTACRVLTEIYN